jgi:hypothetical protein
MPKTLNYLRPCREKVFGPARGIPLDRNAEARIMAYAKGYNARMKQPGQHRGPITRALMEVLQALLWGFHNGPDGRCFPSYESIAARAGCNRDTVYEAIKALESPTSSHGLTSSSRFPTCLGNGLRPSRNCANSTNSA